MIPVDTGDIFEAIDRIAQRFAVDLAAGSSERRVENLDDVIARRDIDRFRLLALRCLVGGVELGERRSLDRKTGIAEDHAFGHVAQCECCR